MAQFQGKATGFWQRSFVTELFHYSAVTYRLHDNFLLFCVKQLKVPALLTDDSKLFMQLWHC